MEASVEDEGLRKNWGYLFVFVILAFVAIAAKLWYLQIIKGGEFAEKVESNKEREIRLAAPRGIIYDREGRELVGNRPSFDVYFHPRSLTAETKAERRKVRLEYLEHLSDKLDVDFSLLKKRFNQGKGVSSIKVKTDIPWKEVAKIKTMSMQYQGTPPLTVDDETKRVYPFGKLMCHFLGYVAEIDQKRLDTNEYASYRPGDYVGKIGLEEHYEHELKGQFGRKVIEENARNVELKTLDITPPIPGQNLTLTVDMDLVQAAASAMRAMNNESGAVIALDPKNGDVLCALSHPGYNPEIFSRILPTDTWNGLVNNPKKPLTNKAISNAYPPGSTWKLVTAIAALESGEISPKWVSHCLGKWKYGDRVFRCWNEKGHGMMNIVSALTHSCDVYFYKSSLKVGVDRIAYWANQLGAGQITGIDLTPETRGTVPTREWKLKKIGSEWIAGETLSCAIGQGYNLVSPLQLALIYASYSNGGTVYRPRMVKKIMDPDGKVVQSFAPEVIRKVQFSDETFRKIQKGLIGCVNGNGGTGHRSKLDEVLVAGKTGTAQVRRIRKHRIHISNMEWEERDHAWFAAYAPADDPEIVVVVLAEHSGHGGTAAAPVAREVIARYMKKRARTAAVVPDEEETKKEQ